MIDFATFDDFVNKWKVLDVSTGLESRLSNFIISWNIRTRPLTSVPSRNPEINTLLLLDFINNVTPLMDKLKIEKRNGESVNVWEIAGVGHDEVRISSVLAWFLNCHGKHGQSNAILSAIIDKLPNKPIGFPTSKDIKSKSYWVNVESCASGERSNRIDIEIGGEAFLLFIEVKVFAGETNNQLERYLQIAETKAGGRPWGIIFLTPEGKQPTVQHPALLSLSWQTVANVLDGHSESLPVASYSRRLVGQFSKHVSKFRR